MVLQRVALALALVLTSFPALPVAPAAADGGDTIDLRLFAQPVTAPDESAPTEVLVKFRGAAAPTGTVLSHDTITGVHAIAVPDGLTVEAFLAQLLANLDVEWAEPNDLVRLDAGSVPLIPTDTLYASHQKWYYDVIEAEAAWGLPAGANPVVVAVLDSGVLCDHPDLSAQMWRNPREIPGNGIDDDANGRIDDVHGWDFVGTETGNRSMGDQPGDNDPCIRAGDPSAGNGLDDDGDGAFDPGVDHGTVVAGIIAASSNNATGVAGLCWSCKIMAVRVGNAEGWVRSGDIAAGIGYAAQNGAKVLNLSFGGSNLSRTVRAAIEAAHDQFGALVVAAAGNDNSSPINCPACVPAAMAVGASDRIDPQGRASFTSWGVNTTSGEPHGIDVVAPGVQLASTTVCSVYTAAVLPAQCPGPGAAKYGLNRSGTSFSAPLVAGLAGLVLTQEPNLTPDALKARIRAAATDLPDDRNDSPNAGADWDGAGMINVFRTLNRPAKLAISAVTPARPRPAPATFSVTLETRHAAGHPAVVLQDTPVSLSLKTGRGALAGIVTGTIGKGSSSVTLTGLTYSTVDTGVVLTAARTGGETLTPDDSSPLEVAPADPISTGTPAPTSTASPTATATATPSPTATPTETAAPAPPAPSGGGGGGGGSRRPATTPTPAPTPPPTSVTRELTSGGVLSLPGVNVEVPAQSIKGRVTASLETVALDVRGVARVQAAPKSVSVKAPEGFDLMSAFELGFKDAAGAPVSLPGVTFRIKAAAEAVVLHYKDSLWTVLHTVRSGDSLILTTDLAGLFAVAAELPKPVITGPAPGAVSDDLAPLLAWDLPAGVTQYHLQVTPHNNDGPGMNLIRNAAGSYQVAPPKIGVGDYVMLPGMTYTWRVRTSGSITSLGENDPGWSGWAGGTFRTAPASGATIAPVGPFAGAEVATLHPALTWRDSAAHVFYYEVQVSRDPAFGSDSFLYSELVHGGVSTPVNTYRIPSQYPLEAGTAYHWRVRPRIQGDGQPAPWSQTWSFKTP